MRNLLGVALLLVAVAAPPARAQTVPAGEAHVRELLTIMKADQNLRTVLPKMLDQVIAALGNKVPDMSAEAREEVTAIMRRTMTDNVGLLIDALVPVYQHNFTDGEIDGLIAFMKTPLGQAYIAKTPQIAVESMQAGLQAGKIIVEKAAQEAVKRLREKGYKI